MLSAVACLSSCGGSGSAETLTNASDRSSLSISSGNNQTGNIGQVLPIPMVVVLLASNGTAISNASLEFRPAEGEPQMIETDASGHASFDWQLGDAYDQQLQISYISTGSQTVSATALAVALYQYREPVNDPAWPTTHAITVDVDTVPLADMINAIRDGTFPRVHTVLLAKDGQIFLDESFPLVGETAYTQSDPELHYVASASKSITATLLGVAIDQGLIGSVDESLYSHFPEYSSFENWSDLKNSVTIRDALLMRSGLDCADDGSWENTQDFVKATLDLPLISAPGSVWKYCSMLTHVLGSAIANVSGMNLADYAQQYLWGPLEVSSISWTYSPAGRAITGYGFWMGPRAMLTFGEMVRNLGMWQGYAHSLGGLAGRISLCLCNRYGLGWQPVRLPVVGPFC